MPDHFILSTVGISIFLNALLPEESGQWRSKLNLLTNETELPPDVSEKLDELKKRVDQKLRGETVEGRRRLSPELNGLYGIYNNQLKKGGDQHFLISTDTALGKAAAEVLSDFLKGQGVIVNIFTPTGLNTKSPIRFSQGMKEMLKWCEETIPGYQENQYNVIFNLTAAFKSLQGYLNIIGMFYADRMVYIFEGSTQLMSIPRLPLNIDMEKISANAEKMALLCEGAVFPRSEITDIPDGLLDEDEKGDVMVSDWGILVWNKVKEDIFIERLLEFPFLSYLPSFQKDFKNATPKQRVDLQKTLAKVSTRLLPDGDEFNQLRMDGGLQYDNYTNKKTKDDRPIGHFRVTLNNRVSCTHHDNGRLNLRHFGVHDYVNKNP